MQYNLDVLNAFKDILVQQKQTLSVAESVTSGHLQAAFSAAPEASLFFQGGITVYNAGQKCRHLNIEPVYALKDNCVSEVVATQMAIETNKLFISEYGIGITGYASILPEAGIHELFSFFAIARKDGIIISQKINTIKANAIEAQIDYTNQVLAAFNDWLTKQFN